MNEIKVRRRGVGGVKSEALPAEYLETLRRAWQKRAKQEKEREEKRRQEALARAVAAARHLKDKYDVDAVYLFGSLVWGKHFTPRSDIDFLVEGFPDASSYWKMLGELEDIAAPFEVNVILSEEATFSLREKARREGKSL